MKGMLLTAFLFMACTTGNVHAERAISANRKGIHAFDAGEYESSVEHFTDALVQIPESALIRFNLGTALAAGERPKEAVSQLNQAASAAEDASLAAAAWFNAGNLLMRSNELDAAITHYRKALKLDQSSPDIRHNLELAVRMKDQQDQQQQDQQPQDQDRQQDEQQQNQDQQEQQRQDQSEQEDGGQEQQDQLSERDPDKRDTPMSIDEAKRILEAMEQEEREALEMRNEKNKSGIQQGNDW